MRDSWIGGACSTHGKDEEYIQVLSRKSEGEETRWKTGCISEIDINVDLTEMSWTGLPWRTKWLNGGLLRVR